MRTGSKMLRVVSIIMLVFCGIGIVLSLLSVAGMSLLGAAAGSAGVGAALGGIVFIVVLLGMGLELAAGILGVKNWNRPDKAMPCIVLGIIILVFSVFSAISNLSSGDGVTIISEIIGLALPILYVVGAFQLKNMAQAVPPQVPGYPYPPQGPTPPPTA